MKSSPLDVGGEHIIPSVTRVFTDRADAVCFLPGVLAAEGRCIRACAPDWYFSATGSASPTRRWSRPRNTTRKRAPLPSASACRSPDLNAGRYTVQAIVVDAGDLLCCVCAGIISRFVPLRSRQRRLLRKVRQAISPCSLQLWGKESPAPSRNTRLSWRRRFAGGFALRWIRPTRRRDAGATRTALCLGSVGFSLRGFSFARAQYKRRRPGYSPRALLI